MAELINVDAKLETAIEAALGAAMQNIVTPTEQDAKFLIDFLRRTDSGRATFLPVSAVKSRSVTEQERSALKINGCFGIASELVKFDKAYSGVIGSLLGRTIIVDNLNTGISIAQNTNHALKIVTLEGDVMNAGGSMSGGSMRSRSSSILGRDREISDVKKLLEQKRDEIKKTNDILSRFSAYCMEIDQKLAKVDEELHRLDVDFARDIEKLKSLENDMQASINSENELLTENEQLDDTLKEIETELDNISRMQGDFESSNTDAQAQINARQYEFNKKQLEKDKLAQQLTDAKIEYAGLEKELDAMRNNKVRMAELIENLEKTKLSLIGEGKKLELQLEQTVKEQEESVSNAGETSNMLDTYSKTEKESQAERDRINAKIRDNEEKRRRFEQDVFDAGERRHKIELSLSKLDSDLSYLENRLWEEYELTQATAEELKDPDFKMTGAQSEINKLKKAISALGNVNVNAIEEYIETKERFDSLSNQRDDLVKAEEDLNKIIDELTKKMDKQFREQFELINKYFTQTFSELFGGGRAELKLENGENSLESDIEIVAQPPGKSLQLLSLLSGGERALTAIAILFAMLKLKPTPFCILDEIEAALDEANVGNFASYLRKFSNDTQFIVITHRKPTMEEADSLYGVAMEEKGVSKIVSVKLT